MQLTGNTVLITGGGTGIGRAMAIALHRRGNRVIVAGRRSAALRELAGEYPGIDWHPLDVADRGSMRQFVVTAGQRWPDLNVLINNAGTMAREDLRAPDPEVPASIVATNLLGPMVLTSLLMPMLRGRPQAAIVNVTSALAFVPLAIAPTYSATKAALRSYTESLRIALVDSRIQVVEIAPPRVRTEMDGTAEGDSVDADEFVADVLAELSARPDASEIVVAAARALRYAEREGRYDRMLATLNTVETRNVL